MNSKKPKKHDRWSRVEKFKDLLLSYKDFSAEQREWFQQNMSNEFIKFIIEISGNLQNGNLKLGKKAWRKLEPFREVLKKLNCCKTSLSKKKTLVNQEGGFIGMLISTVLSSLLTALMSKASK
jgi:hypothetical protein